MKDKTPQNSESLDAPIGACLDPQDLSVVSEVEAYAKEKGVSFIDAAKAILS